MPLDVVQGMVKVRGQTNGVEVLQPPMVNKSRARSKNGNGKRSTGFTNE